MYALTYRGCQDVINLPHYKENPRLATTTMATFLLVAE